MTISAFGEDSDTTEIEIEVDLEENFTLEDTGREMEVYEEFLEGYRKEFAFDHLVASFHAGGGELDLRWEERLDPKLIERRRDLLRASLPAAPGTRCGSRGTRQSTPRAASSCNSSCADRMPNRSSATASRRSRSSSA